MNFLLNLGNNQNGISPQLYEKIRKQQNSSRYQKQQRDLRILSMENKQIYDRLHRIDDLYDKRKNIALNIQNSYKYSVQEKDRNAKLIQTDRKILKKIDSEMYINQQSTFFLPVL